MIKVNRAVLGHRVLTGISRRHLAELTVELASPSLDLALAEPRLPPQPSQRASTGLGSARTACLSRPWVFLNRVRRS